MRARPSLHDPAVSRDSIVYKAWMALTGGFLVLFLLVHCLGNLPLFLPESIARRSFNAYADALGSSVPIKLASVLTYGSIVVHILVAGLLEWRHRGVRRPYARPSPGPWYARSMAVLGSVTLGFLVVHLHTFWYRFHFGEIELDAAGHKDLYGVVRVAFAQPWLVAVHTLGMIALGFHLRQGLPAAVRSLGLYGQRFDALATRAAPWFAWGIAGCFAAMPLYIFVIGERP